jgi:hypothetical protein
VRRSSCGQARHYYGGGRGATFDVAFEVGLTNWSAPASTTSMRVVHLVDPDARHRGEARAGRRRGRIRCPPVAIVDPAQRSWQAVFPTTLVFAEAVSAPSGSTGRQTPGGARLFRHRLLDLIGLQLDREQFDENLKRERR